MTRQEVYTVLDGERAFQDEMSQRTDRPDMIEEMHVGDILSAIQYNLSLATKAWYHGSVPHSDAIGYLRKIAALCIKAGETHGMPSR